MGVKKILQACSRHGKPWDKTALQSVLILVFIIWSFPFLVKLRMTWRNNTHDLIFVHFYTYVKWSTLQTWLFLCLFLSLLIVLMHFLCYLNVFIIYILPQVAYFMLRTTMHNYSHNYYLMFFVTFLKVMLTFYL